MRERREDRNEDELFDWGFGEDKNGFPIFHQFSINSIIMLSGVKEEDYVAMVQEQKAIQEDYLNFWRE